MGSNRVLNFAEFQDNYDDKKGETAGNSQQDVDMFANKADDFQSPTASGSETSSGINIAGTQDSGSKEGDGEAQPPAETIGSEEKEPAASPAVPEPENEFTPTEVETDDDEVPSYEEYAKRNSEKEPESDGGEEGEEKEPVSTPATDTPKEGEGDKGESEEGDEKDVDLGELDDEKYGQE